MAEGLGFDAAGFMQKLIAGEALTSLVPIDAIPGMLKAGVLRGLDGLTMNLALPVLAWMWRRRRTPGKERKINIEKYIRRSAQKA